MPQVSERDMLKIAVVFALYLTSLMASNTLGLKIVPFWFTHISTAIFMFPFVFITTDVIGEVYGKRLARFFVIAGFISTALFIVYSALSLLPPWDPAGAWIQDAYNSVFAVSIRISIASLVAFIVGEYQDVIMFFFVRDRLGDKNFWLRSNISNLWSQFLDTTLFMTIAFYGVYENNVLLGLIVTWWLFKVAVGVLYTPLSYLGIYLLRKA
nr:putative ACR, YhhQ family COG1738 [uncultured bacterium]